MTYDMIRQSRDVVERGGVFTPDNLPPDVRQIDFGTPDFPKGKGRASTSAREEGKKGGKES
jgi:hypothetical protein